MTKTNVEYGVLVDRSAEGLEPLVVRRTPNLEMAVMHAAHTQRSYRAPVWVRQRTVTYSEWEDA